jgi:hypothetical protein
VAAFANDLTKGGPRADLSSTIGWPDVWEVLDISIVWRDNFAAHAGGRRPAAWLEDPTQNLYGREMVTLMGPGRLCLQRPLAKCARNTVHCCASAG